MKTATIEKDRVSFFLGILQTPHGSVLIVTSTNSYKVKVEWGISSTGEASSTANASGTQLTSGISVSKPLYSGDYTEAGIPVSMRALATLTDITGGGNTFIATTTASFTEETIPGTSD